jgi:hypothetical protein
MSAVALALGFHGSLSAAEPAKDFPPGLTWSPAPSTVINPSTNKDGEAWQAYRDPNPKRSVDEHLDDPVLHGAVDLHAHFGPDTLPRQWDAFEVAKNAHARGMRGLVLKTHWSDSASIAYLVRKYANVPGLEVFGGLALNTTVGGINPQAVRYFAELEGKYARIVWLPTHDAETEIKHSKEVRPYVIVSQNGELLPSVLEVLDLIAHYKLTLATGHVYADEMVKIVAEAKKRGVERIIVTHSGLGPMYTNPTIDQLKQVTKMGAYLEVVSAEVLNAAREHNLKVIKALGPEHVIITSDSGMYGWYSHGDALVRTARVLREAGFSERDLDLMFKTNPAKMVGLSPQPPR